MGTGNEQRQICHGNEDKAGALHGDTGAAWGRAKHTLNPLCRCFSDECAAGSMPGEGTLQRRGCCLKVEQDQDKARSVGSPGLKIESIDSIDECHHVSFHR